MSAAGDTATLDRVRLARVLGMLGSDHPGERDAAAMQAERLRKASGLDWYQILSPSPTRPPPTRPPSPPPPRARPKIDIGAALDFCAEVEARLTAWERSFVSSLRDQFRHYSGLTVKQLVILERIARAAQTRASPKPKPKRRNRRRRAA
jgi:hypothetical protein